MKNQPDLLFYFSDQHNGRMTGYAGHPEVQTPHLDRLAADGVTFENTYTSCPLCVPARCSMLTASLTSRIGVYGNRDAFHSEQSTFLHALVLAGYETVLCGRMHFVGDDQRHGFTRRIHGDITPPHHGQDMGIGTWQNTCGMQGCANLGGAGDSPVLAYDRAVIAAATEYLAEDHEKPQCIVVGTYGPHFPYVAPPEFYARYAGRIAAPDTWDPDGKDENPVNDRKRQRRRRAFFTGEETVVTTDMMLAMRAAYFGMITEQDRLVGEVRQAWEATLARRARRGVFCYSSDHGDTCGEHGIFGKQTFYEGSVRIPWVIAGEGIAPNARVKTPVSIMDIGPTLCALVDAPELPSPDGRALAASLRSGRAPESRPVISEWVDRWDEQLAPARMLRYGPWKLIYYHHPDLPVQLFNVEDDPDERHNLVAAQPALRDDLMQAMMQDWNPDEVIRQYNERIRHLNIIDPAARKIPPPPIPGEKWDAPRDLIDHPEKAFTRVV